MTWSDIEVGVLARAAANAPSVHNSRPWAVEIHPDGAEVYERFEARLPRHDPSGRDRMISCGAVVTNVELAVRALGRRAEVTLFPDGARPDLVARVAARGREPATEDEVNRYSAIYRRRSYRAPFALQRLARHEVAALVAAAGVAGTQIRPVHADRESPALAELLGYAGRVLRADRAYQRELSAWSDQFRDPLPLEPTLPWSGLVRADSHLPDTITLTERLAREQLLLVLTPDDARRDHVLAGRALQQVWLTAVANGLVGSVLTQPLQLHEVRAGLIARLGLAGHPQAFLRLGYPVNGVLTAQRAAAGSGTGLGPRRR
ncbi:Acg family FMN-binding oxidoreductase [Amycolatopsis sacchari]|uniref:Acg family FMN-binding oxidoreductase n=1 Tax=Amycolatopsis sacchari TaxID=115433 RepID=UPI003D75EE2D